MPVLRETDEMSFADIEKNISELGNKARDGKLQLKICKEELTIPMAAFMARCYQRLY